MVGIAIFGQPVSGLKVTVLQRDREEVRVGHVWIPLWVWVYVYEREGECMSNNVNVSGFFSWIVTKKNKVKKEVGKSDFALDF